MSARRVTAQPVSATPIYHWYGARPAVLDLPPEQSGWLACLLFARQGDCCLLPLAWYVEQPDPHGDVPYHEPLPLVADALAPGTARVMERMLEDDGWQMTGRLLLEFTGREATAAFDEQVALLLRLSSRPGGE